MQTHTLIAKSRLCILIMSSDIVHSIDTNQSKWEGVKTGSKFANLIATMVRSIGCELHAL